MANQIVIHGRLTHEPSLKTFQGKNGDNVVCNISVACNRSFGDEADFFNCFQFGKGAEALDKYFTKGKEIIVYGEMQMSPYTDKNGSKRQGWKCKINQWEFCGSKADNGSSNVSNSDEPTVDSFKDVEEDIPF